MILTGDEILKAVRDGDVVIDPFDESRLQPNSYDLALAPDLETYDEVILDMKRPPRRGALTVPPEGLVLLPGVLYVGSTVERCGSDRYVTCIETRSSLARLGMSTHLSAGWGDLGWKGAWCLEITVVHPLRVYAGARVCQAAFFEVKGERSRLYRGKYSGGAEASRSHEDFAKEQP